jgi:hypothetical protein
VLADAATRRLVDRSPDEAALRRGHGGERKAFSTASPTVAGRGDENAR